jgi:hypothetical protein
MYNAATDPGNFSYAHERRNLPAKFGRCVTYGFRGDTRDPVEIQQARFTPNYTRPSHIAKQVQKQKVPEKDVRQAVPMDLPRFLGNQEFGEFISTSKSVAIARMFATSTWGPGACRSTTQRRAGSMRASWKGRSRSRPRALCWAGRHDDIQGPL